MRSYCAGETRVGVATPSRRQPARGVVSGDVSTIVGPRKAADEVNKLGRFDAAIHNAGIAALIAQFGWRAMVLILAGIVLLIVLPLLLLMRDHQQDLGLSAYGATTGQDLAPPAQRQSDRGGIPRIMGWVAGAGFLADLGWDIRM